MSRDIIYLVIGSSHGRMAQLVVPTGTFSQMRDVDVNRLLASRSLEFTEGSPKNPNILGEIVRIVRIRSHGSVGRAHRSHRWGHWFESSTDHAILDLQRSGIFHIAAEKEGVKHEQVRPPHQAQQESPQRTGRPEAHDMGVFPGDEESREQENLQPQESCSCVEG